MKDIRFYALQLLSLYFICSSAGNAASFECSKASTRVEKTICSNQELSRLDEELGDAYAQVLARNSNRVAIKRTQQRWLKERDTCTNSECLRGRYLRRISALKLAAKDNVAAESQSLRSGVDAEPKYPNVWNRSVPANKLISVSKHGGDYLLIYETSSEWVGGHAKITQDAKYFFGGNVLNNIPIEMLAKLSYIQSETSGKLLDGVSVSLKNLDPRNPQRCPQALNHYYQIRYPDGEVLNKSILYVLNDFRTTEIDKKCADTSEETLKESVVSLQGEIVPIDDGGFFLIDDFQGIVLRFDRHMNTESGLLGRRLFVVDTSRLEKLIAHEAEVINYQKSQLDVVKYIRGIMKQGSDAK